MLTKSLCMVSYSCLKWADFMPKLTKKELRQIYKALALITYMGVSVVISVGLGIFIGWLLDRWLGTTPWFMLIFTILGIIAAIKSMYTMAKRVI